MFGNPSYPTYQAFLGLGIAAAIALLLMPWWIKLLKVYLFNSCFRKISNKLMVP